MKIFLLISLLVFTSSCSLNKFVVGQMSPVFKVSVAALYEETDLKLAETAIASNLKLLEGLLKNDPVNEDLLLLLAQGYSGYALGFVEDEDPKRAKVFYHRAFNFGLRAFMELEEDEKWNWSATNQKRLKTAIADADKGNIAALFWTTFSLAGGLNVSLDDPAALIHLPIVESMSSKVEEIDDSFFYGSVYLLKGAIAGMTPKMLGGNPETALKYIDKSSKISGGNFILADLYKAKYYAAKTLNEELFDQLIKKIEDFDIGTNPIMALFNQIAKKKAALLKSQREDLF